MNRVVGGRLEGALCARPSAAGIVGRAAICWAYLSVTPSVTAMVREVVDEIAAEMVANVLSVGVGPGDRVLAGDEVALLESMKMEIPVLSERAGTVRSVFVVAGDVVQGGDALLDLVRGR